MGLCDLCIEDLMEKRARYWLLRSNKSPGMEKAGADLKGPVMGVALPLQGEP